MVSRAVDVSKLKNCNLFYIQGYHGTIFAYGQTGAGKTFTMEGLSDKAKKQKEDKS